MTYTLKQIAADMIHGKLEFSEKELAANRIVTSERCENFTKVSRQCKLCSCFMDAKTKLLHAGCPVNKW